MLGFEGLSVRPMVAAPLQPGSDSRLNVLLSDAGWREQSWAAELPRLLAPMGIQALRVQSGKEAASVIRSYRIHIAVIDLGLPLETPVQGTAGPSPVSDPLLAALCQPETGGTRILQLLRRLDSPPPTVVIRRSADKAHANQRSLCEALREGAFAVLDSPVQIEQILEVMRRILRRHYSDSWPSQPSSS